MLFQRTGFPEFILKCNGQGGATHQCCRLIGHQSGPCAPQLIFGCAYSMILHVILPWYHCLIVCQLFPLQNDCGLNLVICCQQTTRVLVMFQDHFRNLNWSYLHCTRLLEGLNFTEYPNAKYGLIWYSTSIYNPFAPCMVHLPTKLGHKHGANVAQYSSTMVRIWEIGVPLTSTLSWDLPKPTMIRGYWVSELL